MTKADTKVDEGARGFSVTVQQIDSGCLHAELSEEQQALIGSLYDYAIKFGKAAKGTLTLVLDFTADPNGTVTVQGEVKTKEPKTPKVKSLFYISKGNNLVLDNPKQQVLGLREIAGGFDVREVPATPAVAARNV